MQVESTNSSQPVQIEHNGRVMTTGIFKIPRADGILLTRNGVEGDTIGNPEVHGGQLKACYLFSVDEYAFWREEYPDLEWGYGMFGENLSVSGLDEQDLRMGASYRVGDAEIRITSPREPCYKLGIRFGNQNVVEQFVLRGRPGTYVEVLKEGRVRPGDAIELLEGSKHPSIHDYYRMLFAPDKDPDLLRQILATGLVSAGNAKHLKRWLQN